MTQRLLTGLLMLWAVPLQAQAKPEKVDGYLEWRQGEDLVVDGQRVRLGSAGKFKGKGEAADLASVPLGYEVKAKGLRAQDGLLVAFEIEAKPNGSALFEKNVKSATDDAEREYRRAGRFYQEADGGKRQTIGELEEDGPRVERVRRIMDALVPPYLDADEIRVYVIDNDEWNAFAMGNYSIYTFSGLLDDMDDDEVAIVLGHELAHATHEHTRRQFKKAMWIQLAALGVSAAAEEIDDKKARAVTQLLTAFGALAWSNGFGRNLEDQADRVGLRYAYEGGFDITKGPRLWNRFAKKYGEPGKVSNFFFGNHSLARERALALERELALNYPEGARDDGPRYARGRSRPRETHPASRPRPASLPSQPSETTRALLPVAPSSGAAKEIQIGMTENQVRALVGPPSDQVAFGGKSKWTYPGMTVVFEGGKVKDVKF